jgi:hypothetical protein
MDCDLTCSSRCERRRPARNNYLAAAGATQQLDGQNHYFRFSEIVSSPKIKNISLFQK